MGGIHDEHVEWAVVSRLKAMLEEPPKTTFNVTQSFALFTAILLWTKNRTWVGGNGEDRPAWFSAADHAARDAREALRHARICDAPWSLSRVSPRIVAVDELGAGPHPINFDFAEMSAEDFFKWLRDALAHGDGRTIRPVHKPSAQGNRTLLAGFAINFAEHRGADRELRLELHHRDMKRLGAILADQFCQSLSGGDLYFEEQAGAAPITELKPTS
ncbi:hypothetical protein HZF05_03035 [Sphingomonas sp. CGMCC 1.13654]|uniref:Uncharacterized protein n=1 Tax=Sphingomonas chungangi TaxID=2683589 RepID=A0A838L338_9SPHN|nr:hypothetical protein [Sphingomonas chungangi]MBA2933065.1 hypothetical protein [Sphingomonas chungangi]MVW56685.1 hypothetical protein [Sphingomonas chungangi]